MQKTSGLFRAFLHVFVQRKCLKKQEMPRKKGHRDNKTLRVMNKCRQVVVTLPYSSSHSQRKASSFIHDKRLLFRKIIAK